MKITLDFDPSDEKDIDQLIETLKGLGVLEKVQMDRRRHVLAMPVHVLYNAWPQIGDKYIDALTNAEIKTIGQALEHFRSKDQQKVKGIGDITEARIYAAINFLYSKIS